jgi:hypothetical protein
MMKIEQHADEKLAYTREGEADLEEDFEGCWRYRSERV